AVEATSCARTEPTRVTGRVPAEPWTGHVNVTGNVRSWPVRRSTDGNSSGAAACTGPAVVGANRTGPDWRSASMSCTNGVVKSKVPPLLGTLHTIGAPGGTSGEPDPPQPTPPVGARVPVEADRNSSCWRRKLP